MMFIYVVRQSIRLSFLKPNIQFLFIYKKVKNVQNIKICGVQTGSCKASARKQNLFIIWDILKYENVDILPSCIKCISAYP